MDPFPGGYLFLLLKSHQTLLPLKFLSGNVSEIAAKFCSDTEPLIGPEAKI